MRLIAVCFASTFVLGSLVGCGGSGGGSYYPSGNSTPTEHVLATSQSAPLFSGYYGFDFTLPVDAEVTYSASSPTNDTYDIALFTAAQWVSFQTGSGNQAYAPHNNTTAASDTATMPAGESYLGFRCTNLIERCGITFDLSATY